MTTKEKTGSTLSVLWSVPVAVDEIPDAGLHIEIDASAATRAGLLDFVAELASVRDLPQLSAVFDLTRQRERVHVAGQVRARVGQTCVVTLEPIENAVQAAVDLRFAPASAGAKQPAGGFEGKNSKPGAEPPEPLVGGMLDLGAIATEFLILGIDPYPRKPGAEFAPPVADDGGIKPFAALEELKKRQGGGQS